VGHWTLDPLQLAPPIVLAIAYGMRVRTLRRRGAPPPTWRIVCFALGILALLVAVASPIDYYGEERSQAFHMAQHLLIGDLAPLALLAGVTGPILRPLLKYVHPLRRIFHPFAAITLWALNLCFWHIPFFYDAALNHDTVHALEHACFFAGGVLVWVPILEPIPMPEWFGTGWKLAFVAVVRVVETILGNIFIWANHPFYSPYVDAARPWGLSAVNDQRLAGSIMMIEGSLLTLSALAWLFLRLAEEGELRQRLLESGLDPRVVRRAVRYGRAQELDVPR
jgi:cytochrome c oxidase assembly factor CtaG